MGWPTFPGTIAEDAVKVRRAVVTQDASRGRRYSYPKGWEPTNYAVAVVPATAEEVDQFSREGEVVRFNVVSAIKLGEYRDQLLWIEMNMLLTIVSILPSGSITGRTWDHHCEVHSG